MAIKKEFLDFISKGNVIDLAVGIIIGIAFGKIVSSLVEDIIMPPLGLLIGNIDFGALKISLSDSVAIRYGLFISSIVNFIVVSLAIFIVLKFIAKYKQ